jgi:hypothetical protein
MANSIAPFTRHEKKDIMSTIPLSFLDNINGGDYYATWKLTDVGLSKEAFEFAYKGYNYLKKNNRLTNNNVLTIIDYSKPSSQKRLYVIDMNDGRILFHSLAAHGKNSGLVYAGNFSNQSSSLKTSLGFFITGNTYTGENGYSLKLSGCEKGINDKAFQRAIVIHGANYATDYFLQQNGYLGRSHGCPAVPENISKRLINVIKNGSCVFLYHPTKKYITTSKILNSGA